MLQAEDQQRHLETWGESQMPLVTLPGYLAWRQPDPEILPILFLALKAPSLLVAVGQWTTRR